MQNAQAYFLNNTFTQLQPKIRLTCKKVKYPHEVNSKGIVHLLPTHRPLSTYLQPTLCQPPWRFSPSPKWPCCFLRSRFYPLFYRTIGYPKVLATGMLVLVVLLKMVFSCWTLRGPTSPMQGCKRSPPPIQRMPLMFIPCKFPPFFAGQSNVRRHSSAEIQLISNFGCVYSM